MQLQNFGFQAWGFDDVKLNGFGVSLNNLTSTFFFNNLKIQSCNGTLQVEPETLPNCLSFPHSKVDDLFLLLQALSTVIAGLLQ